MYQFVSSVGMHIFEGCCWYIQDLYGWHNVIQNQMEILCPGCEHVKRSLHFYPNPCAVFSFMPASFHVCFIA